MKINEMNCYDDKGDCIFAFSNNKYRQYNKKGELISDCVAVKEKSTGRIGWYDFINKIFTADNTFDVNINNVSMTSDTSSYIEILYINK